MTAGSTSARAHSVALRIRGPVDLDISPKPPAVYVALVLFDLAIGPFDLADSTDP